MNIHSRKPARWAFTLVEVLIAIGILSMVITAIYACWSAVLRSSKIGGDAAAKVQRSRMAVRCMEDALTYARMNAAHPDLYWFEGESGDNARLSFVARLPESFPRGAKFGDLVLRRIEFSVVPGEDPRRQLVVRQAPLLMEFDEDEANYPLVLARDVEEMTVEFWDPSEEDWIDEWTETNMIPPMVRLTLATAALKGNMRVKDETTVLVSPACRALQPAFQGAVRQPPPRAPGPVNNQPPPGGNPQ